MGSNRKLQTEIDRTLKKVDEGVEEFDAIWEKVYSATQQNQKEKYEGDLKKEIKKLQRHRDSIKSWIASNDIKDKKQLLDARKLIETKMEQFKVCEKETKTKAFSKEGLARAAMMDPEEQAKNERREWLQDKIDHLNNMADGFEADIERLNSGKKKKSNDAKIAQFENGIAAHKYHIGRLEQIMRLMDNDELSPDQIEEVKDDVEFYLETSDDIEAIEAFGGDTYDFYEVLEMDSLSGPTPSIVLEKKKTSSSLGADDAEEEEEKPAAAKDKKKKTAKAAVSSIPMTIGRPVGKKEKEKPESKPVSSNGSSTASSKPATPAAPTPKSNPAPVAALPPGVGRPTAAQAVANAQNKELQPPTSVPSPSQSLHEEQKVAQQLHRQAAQAPLPGGRLAQPPAPQQQLPPPPPQPPQQQLPPKPPQQQNVSQQQGSQQQYPAQQVGQSMPSPTAADVARGSPRVRTPDSMAAATQDMKLYPPTSPGMGGALQGKAATASPHGLGVGITPRQEEKSSAGERDISDMLNHSMACLPLARDSDRLKQYVPRNPYNAPSQFPTQPSPLFENPAFFSKLSTDTLFFIFYYQQGTYQQYLAAKELKRQSWRYHSKFTTWFQRHEEPTVTTDEYEQGTYVYFDYETGWCQRIKTDFIFEYLHLEGDSS